MIGDPESLFPKIARRTIYIYIVKSSITPLLSNKNKINVTIISSSSTGNHLKNFKIFKHLVLTAF